MPRETGRLVSDDDTRFSGSLAMSPNARAVHAGLGTTTDPLLYQASSASPDGGLLAVGIEDAMWMWQLDPGCVVDEVRAGGIQLAGEEWGRGERMQRGSTTGTPYAGSLLNAAGQCGRAARRGSAATQPGESPIVSASTTGMTVRNRNEATVQPIHTGCRQPAR